MANKKNSPLVFILYYEISLVVDGQPIKVTRTYSENKAMKLLASGKNTLQRQVKGEDGQTRMQTWDNRKKKWID